MRVLDQLVFDEPLEGLDNHYTHPSWNDVLGRPDRVWLFVVATQAEGAIPLLTVQVEHSPNELDWTSLNAAPEISMAALSLTEATRIVTDVITNASTFVRLRITFRFADNAARIRVFATERDTPMRQTAPRPSTLSEM